MIETKEQRVARKQLESLALESAERKQRGVFNTRTVERCDLLSILPVGQPRQHAYGNKKSKDPDFVRIYLLRFQSIRNIGYQFIKIGITNVDPSIRFLEDSFRYKIGTLGFVNGLNRSEAREIEATLHSMFADAKHYPKPRLICGGNTECFDYEEEIVKRTLEVFEAFNSEIDRLKKLA